MERALNAIASRNQNALQRRRGGNCTAHNVPHGLAAHLGWLPTFAKPPPKPPHSDAKQPTLALYRTIQPKISFRVYFYCLLTRTRVMPSLTAPSTPPFVTTQARQEIRIWRGLTQRHMGVRGRTVTLDQLTPIGLVRKDCRKLPIYI
jgi:hypothetical protein